MKKIVLAFIVLLVIGIGSFAFAQQAPQYSNDIEIVALQVQLLTEKAKRLAFEHQLVKSELEKLTEHYKMLLAEQKKAETKKKAEKAPEKSVVK